MIEALVAFSLLSIALATLYGMAGDVFSDFTRSRETTIAEAYARSKLQALAASSVELPASGEFANGVRWRIEGQPIATSLALPGGSAQPVMLTLIAIDRADREIVSLRTIVIRAVAQR